MRTQDGQPSGCMNMCFKSVSQISFSHVCYRKRNDKNCLSSVQKTSPSLPKLSSLTVMGFFRFLRFLPFPLPPTDRYRIRKEPLSHLQSRRDWWHPCRAARFLSGRAFEFRRTRSRRCLHCGVPCRCGRSNDMCHFRNGSLFSPPGTIHHSGNDT